MVPTFAQPWVPPVHIDPPYRATAANDERFSPADPNYKDPQ
jgi:hypothetical protein